MRRISAAAVLLAMISLLTGATGAGAQGSLARTRSSCSESGARTTSTGSILQDRGDSLYELMGLTYDLLVDFSKDSSPVPGLADSWETPKTASPGPSTSTKTLNGTTANP